LHIVQHHAKLELEVNHEYNKDFTYKCIHIHTQTPLKPKLRWKYAELKKPIKLIFLLRP